VAFLASASVLAGLVGCASGSAATGAAAPTDTASSSASTTSSGSQSASGSTSTAAQTVRSSSSASATSGSTGEGGAADAGGCSSLPLCDGFESDTPGMAPDPSVWHAFLGCNPNATNAATSGGLTIGIDDTVHHNGSNSLRVVGGDSCGYYAITTSAFSSGALGPQVYARFYARFSGSGGDAGAATQNHDGFLSMYSGSTTGADPSFFSNYNTAGTTSGQLRLGFQDNVVDWNNIIGGKDSTLPDLDPMGTSESVSPAATTWDCYEFHIDQTNGQIEFWFDGTSVAGLTWAGTATTGVNDQWSTAGPQSLELQSFGLGWLGLNAMETAWYDDVALAGSRIGCD
jgi:hypothetical protein